MDAANRAIIAYIAGRLITGASGWSVRDHDRKRLVQFEAFLEGGEIKVYCHELHGTVSGRGAEGRYMLFQHRVNGSVDLLINAEEKTFSGWEHRSCFHFFGNAQDRAVRLFDYQDQRWHLYTL